MNENSEREADINELRLTRIAEAGKVLLTAHGTLLVVLTTAVAQIISGKINITIDQVNSVFSIATFSFMGVVFGIIQSFWLPLSMLLGDATLPRDNISTANIRAINITMAWFVGIISLIVFLYNLNKGINL